MTLESRAIVPAASAPATWLEVDQVARLLSLSAAHVRRKAAELWASQNLARIESGRWLIAASADPALSVLTPGDSPGAKALASRTVASSTLATLPKKARELATHRAAIVRRWREQLAAAQVLGQSADAVTTAFLLTLSRENTIISRATLYNWARAIDEGGLESAVDGRHLRKAKRTLDYQTDPFLQAIKQIWGTQQKRGLPVCHTAACWLAAQNGWEVRSLSQCRRFLASLPIGFKVLAREGEEAYVNQIKPHHTRDYTSIDSNDLWVSDHHQFDVWVRCGERINPSTGQREPVYKRPYITGWMDMRSRKIVGWLIRDLPGSYEPILQTLCMGCLEFYIPSAVLTDNGDDYDNQVLTGETKKQRHERLARARRSGTDPEREARALGIYAALGIKHMHSLPYHPQGKTKERFFRTICERFSKLFATYCGNSPENRPEDVENRMAEAPTLEQFRAMFEEWLKVDYNSGRDHQGQGVNDWPDRVWAANLREKRTAPREVLEVLMQPRFERKVNQLGVEWNGLTYGRYVLNEWISQKLYIRVNLQDVTRVSVWTARDEFIAFAPANEMMPVLANSTDVAAAQKKLQAFAKAQKAAFDLQPPINNVAGLMLSAAADKAEQEARKRPALPAPAPTLKLVRPDISEQLPQIAAAADAALAAAQRPALPAGPSMADVLNAYSQGEDEL